MNLRALGEDKVVAALLRELPAFPPGGHVILGPGDDCAVIGSPRDKVWQLLKTDCVIESVHFRREEDAAKVGWKALARPISDMAAMGGQPCHALVTLAAPPETDLKWATKLYSGLRKCAEKFGVLIVGGETARSPGPLFISVALTGQVERRFCISRSGCAPGDRLFVTGRLGGSLAGRHLTFSPRVEQAGWLVRKFKIHGMMDISDGLAADLPRMARASNCGFHLDEASLPLNPDCTAGNALSDGEDYELLFALSSRDARDLPGQWKKQFPRLRLTEIGELTAKPGGKEGESLHGYDHFT